MTPEEPNKDIEALNKNEKEIQSFKRFVDEKPTVKSLPQEPKESWDWKKELDKERKSPSYTFVTPGSHINWDGIEGFLRQAISTAEERVRDGFHSRYSGKPIKHPVPCQDCGSDEWVDWFLPHPVFNAVCPGGDGYLCLPCFAERMSHRVSTALAKREKELVEKIELLRKKPHQLNDMYPLGLWEVQNQVLEEVLSLIRKH